MRTNTFVDRLTDHGQFSATTEAREATRATLVTLSELLPAEDSEALARPLPDDLADWVRSTKPVTDGPGDADGFRRRVAERLRGGVTTDQADQQARLVLATLREAAGTDTWDRVAGSLPADVRELAG